MPNTHRASRSLSLAALLFAAACGSLVVMAYSYAQQSPGTAELQARAAGQVDEWTRLREATRASMAAAMGGDPSARARYLIDTEQLTQHMHGVKRLIRSSQTATAFLEAQTSTYELLRVEREALEAARTDPTRARAILGREAYANADQQLSQQLGVFMTAIEDLKQRRVRAFATLAITIVTLVTGACLWLFGWSAADKSSRSRRELEEQANALRDSERKYRNIIEHAVVGVMRVAPDGVILSANPALVDCLGYSSAAELIGADVRMLYVDPQERDRLLQVLGSQGFIQGIQLLWKRKDGARVSVRLTSRAERNPEGEIEVFDDIVEDVTERVVLGEQLRQAQKMEAIGRLAGGVAHDFNNLLTVIAGNAELLAEDESLSPSAAECVEQILNATQSATGVTRGLLVFSRKSTPQPEVVSVNESIQRVHKLMARLVGEDIQVTANLDPGAGTVFVDPTHMEQTLLNLVVNARDAMPNGGQLTFRTQQARDGVRISVSDTGCGMDDSTKARAFDPFFTTKPAGRGTGLGLPMVYGFVHQAGGTVDLQSAPGEGTTVMLTLPVSTGRPSSALNRPASQASAAGSETVVVVEDEESLRKLVADVLRRSGYDVMTAADAREAREILGDGRSVDLVLSDVVMPGESGIELAAWARLTSPQLRVSFMSGFADHPAMRELASESFLQKPFTPAALLAHVRSSLDRAGAAGGCR